MPNDSPLHQLVFEGAWRGLGMPNLKDISEADLKAVQHDIRCEARKAGLAPQ